MTKKIKKGKVVKNKYVKKSELKIPSLTSWPVSLKQRGHACAIERMLRRLYIINAFKSFMFIPKSNIVSLYIVY